ncbi:cytochrome P450 76B1 [Verticillium alfalfae VaMs.102]|uniref:Cytochrome P450 76B1 n=1 Tax=Verticillium alfalfae (strain VaMs.102 / ATCC MYA-4576 / FGSC 10136) TaxID=526221 RepID=C9SW88_VERA1|nr:cytochrome P450 76B1 [Verticillium alfalfae VaMs.102]EEY23053.1 cytochrome P450 76B1 [Verticillium alfalfae VaMs.102]
MAVIETVAFLAQKARENTLEASVVLLVAVPIVYVVINEFVRSNARIKGMKGPRGLPLIGNLWDIRTNAADQYRHWAKKHGDVYQVQLGNVPVVIVNSASAAKSLFGQHSQALSSRPETYTFHKVVSSTAGTTIGTSPYSESLKRRRKGAASALNRPSVQTYVPLLDVETRDFIEELYIDGKAGTAAVDPMPMIQRLSLSLALSLNWGVRMSNRGELFEEITHVEEEVSRFRSTTGNYQDYVPLLRLNPFNFHSAKAREMRHRRDVYLTALNQGLEQRMKDGTYKPCIQANVMLDEEARLNAEELTSISLTMLSGGLDTLTTLVAWFIGLLVHKPEIQEKAVQEIRAFFGDNEPLCDSEDDQKCPYMVALVRESLRYYTVLRLALPRATVRDVVHNGITIPKGSTLFLNAWACNMDGNVWSDPEAFRPERWLEQPDAPLFTFKIVKHDDFESDPVKGNADPTSLVALPKRYCAKFVPRNETALRKALDSTRQVESEKL